MTSIQDVTYFLGDFHQKLKIWNILFRDDRSKNTQTLAELEISPVDRVRVIEALIPEDYSDGPLVDILNKGNEMWVFGKRIKKLEVYIKVTIGDPGSNVICISFHIAANLMNYPFKN